jgi:hypothetical protein
MFEGVTDAALLARARRLQLNLQSQGNAALHPPYSNAALMAPDFSFRFSGVAPGKYRLSLYGPNELRGFALARLEHNEGSLPDGLEITGSEQINGLRVVLVYGNARIVGQVQFSGGDLPANARVSVAAFTRDNPNLSSRFAQVDARGRFVLEHLSAGTYELRVSASVPTGEIHQNSSPPAPVYRQIAAATQQIVVGNTGETPLTITLEPTPQRRRQ